MSNDQKIAVSRISMSLPQHLLKQLDVMIGEKGFESRSSAIASMIQQQLTEHQGNYGGEIMAGTINLVYDHSTPGIQKHLADLQHEYTDEVISSLHVNLVKSQTMEVILVQGPAVLLNVIANKMMTCRGVITGSLQMSTAILPPVHPLPELLPKNRENNDVGVSA